MDLLKTFSKAPARKIRRISEDAAGGSTGAGSVAGTRGLLFNAPASMIKRFTSDFNKDYNSKPVDGKKAKKKGLGLAEAFAGLNEDGDDQFDQTEVISKLKGLENKEKTDARDTVSFGIEDDDDQIVRVTVRSDQAEQFEKALQSVMAEMDEDDSSKTEIAEILYKLKDHFDIVDVVWPEVQEDEEEGDQQFGNEQGAPGGDGLEGLEDPNAAADPNADPNAEGGELGDLGDMGGEVGAGEGDVQGLLGQVIDMMKADAEARKADAEARIADAKQREQEAGHKTALAKIKQEEQFLDMDDYSKKQKEQDKEAKRLAQLAKWKSQMGSEGNTGATADTDMGLPPQDNTMSGSEEEETTRHIRGRSTPNDLARRIIGRK